MQSFKKDFIGKYTQHAVQHMPCHEERPSIYTKSEVVVAKKVVSAFGSGARSLHTRQIVTSKKEESGNILLRHSQTFTAWQDCVDSVPLEPRGQYCGGGCPPVIVDRQVKKEEVTHSARARTHTQIQTSTAKTVRHQ